MRQSIFVFLTIVCLLVPSQVMALGEEDILNILNGASTLSGTGRDWTGTGAVFAPPVLVDHSGIPTIGSFHELNTGESAEIHLFIGDPENRARWVEWEATNLEGTIVDSGEIDCLDMTLARIPIRFEQPGLYYMAFYLTSKVRGQQRFIFSWNEAIQRNTDVSQMLITVSENSSVRNSDLNNSENTANDGAGLYLVNSGVNFGSLPRYFVGGISNFQIWSEMPTNWTVYGPNGIQSFTNEVFLNLTIDQPGYYRFQTDRDSMEIYVSSGASRSHAISDSRICADTSEGLISISLSAHAEAYAESNPMFIIGIGETVREEIDNSRANWSNYYPINARMFRVGIPQNQLIRWYWDEGTCPQVDPTCGLPPSDWGWEPPVPPPPSDSWSPEVPPIP
ncbi:MAG: hypothetical protein ABH837_00155 [bacterium]